MVPIMMSTLLLKKHISYKASLRKPIDILHNKKGVTIWHKRKLKSNSHDKSYALTLSYHIFIKHAYKYGSLEPLVLEAPSTT